MILFMLKKYLRECNVIYIIKMNKMFKFGYFSRILRRSMCTPAPSSGPASPPRPGSMSARYRPSEFQKFILVWTKKFKNKQEIPTFVSADLIERSRSEARIKIANVLMLLTALASLGAILNGKAAAKRGESVHQMNLDWHKQYEEDYKKKHGNAKAE